MSDEDLCGLDNEEPNVLIDVVDQTVEEDDLQLLH
jgi:hypothetical protein